MINFKHKNKHYPLAYRQLASTLTNQAPFFLLIKKKFEIIFWNGQKTELHAQVQRPDSALSNISDISHSNSAACSAIGRFNKEAT